MNTMNRSLESAQEELHAKWLKFHSLMESNARNEDKIEEINKLFHYIIAEENVVPWTGICSKMFYLWYMLKYVFKFEKSLTLVNQLTDWMMLHAPPAMQVRLLLGIVTANMKMLASPEFPCELRGELITMISKKLCRARVALHPNPVALPAWHFEHFNDFITGLNLKEDCPVKELWKTINVYYEYELSKMPVVDDLVWGHPCFVPGLRYSN